MCVSCRRQAHPFFRGAGCRRNSEKTNGEGVCRPQLEIRPMLKELFTSPEFYAESSRGNQVKSPIRLLVGACRDLAIEGEVTPTLAQTTAALGQELFNPPTVKGWPSGVAWINASSLALRYRLAETLLDAKELTTEPLGRERLTLVPRLPEEAAKTIRRLLELDAEFQTMQRRDGIRVRVDAKKLATAREAEEPDKLVDHLLQRMTATTVRRRHAMRSRRHVAMGRATSERSLPCG
ncbi:MAG: DUF1800 family protein [Gemmataceae bacterium]